MIKPSIFSLKKLPTVLGFLFFLGMVNYSNAQALLDYCSGYTYNGRLPEDRMIGDDITQITITVKGGDGGHAIIDDNGLCFNKKTAKGGSAATVIATFPIGSGSGYLQPGGILRVFSGGNGQDHKVNCGNDAFAGGGGSSAVVYLPPGKDPIGPNWKILMVAGGGGGGANLGGSAQHKGLGANDIEKGDDVDGGNAGVNGGCSDSHDDGLFVAPGQAGGSVFCFDNTEKRGGSMLEFINYALVTDGNGSYALLPNSKISLMHGKSPFSGSSFEKGDGGSGFTGGAAGHGGGGGGGGYSGGAGSTKNGGGGGGSYINESFNPTFSSKTPGTDGGSTNSTGFVTFSWSQSNAGTCGEIAPGCDEEITFASSPTGDDLIIPDGINSIEIDVKGGDGGDGNTVGGLCSGINVKGGEGATIMATFEVGNTGNRLRPGGRLRYFTGQSGSDMNFTLCSTAFWTSGGSGGGSSALLYQAPGEYTWKVLAIAGGGGGGTALYNGQFPGIGGQSEENGFGGGSPSNPCPKGNYTSGTIFTSPTLYAAAGGGFDCTYSGTGAWGESAGWGDVNNATLGLASNTPGLVNTLDAPDGGGGFQGGGAGLTIGGGGGGYYGGVAGGGGSFFNTGFANSGLQKISGATGGGTNSNGHVTIKFIGTNTPTAVCKNTTVYLDSNGAGSIDPSDIDNGSTGSCSGFGFALSKTSFDCSDLGTQTVTLTATNDNNGNSSFCTATVTVADAIAPTAACTGLTVQLDVNGSATISTSVIDNNSSDNCGVASLNLSKTSFNCSDVGANTVTLTATDNSGNSSACTANVMVEDKVAPATSCQNVTVQLNASGNGSTSAGAVGSNSSDACGIASLALSKTSFDCSNVGANAVTLTVTDNNGNSSTCSATVTVEDKVAPAAICQNVTVQLDANGNGSTTKEAINNGSGDACGIANLALSQTDFNCSNVGANAVTLTVTDNNSNSSTCSATVTVTDQVAPIAVCQNVTVQLDTRGNGSASAGAVDNNSSDACGIANLSLSNTGFDCNDIGANAVTLTVTDNNGNSSTCSATVTVEDNVAPAAICQDVTIQLDADGNGTTYTEAINNGSSDACGIDGYALSQSSFDCSHVGANTVTLFVTDIHGNGGTCNATVTVEDLVAPELSSELIFLGCKPEVNYDQYEVTGSASDNCGVGADSYVIALPYMESPTMVFSEKNNKMLKFLFIQNKIIVEAPGVGGAEAWWDEIEDQGGVAVSLGQVFDLSGVEGSNSINYLFDNNGDLKNVTAFSMTMVHTVTDLSGNLTSESYTVSRQCLVENRSNSNGSAQLTGNDPDVTKDKSAVNGVQVFPNPSANKTSIQYELLKPAAVLIDVIDLRGVRVARLLRADQDAGIHRINWDGSTPGGGPVVPGMYIIQLRIGAEILNKKVIRE